MAREELAEMIHRTLGHLDAATFDAFVAIQERLQQEHSELVEQFKTVPLSRETMLHRFDELMKRTMEECRTLFGEERFLKVFGEAGNHPEDLIDRAAFAADQAESEA